MNDMVRWYYRSLFDELEEIRNYMETLNRQVYDTNPVALLPGHVLSSTRLLPSLVDQLRVTVADTPGEVVITADLIPGVSRKDISLNLISPYELEISCQVTGEVQEEGEGYLLQGRRSGCMTRVIPVPGPVSEDGARATLNNGVLTVQLKKSKEETHGTIPIS